MSAPARLVRICGALARPHLDAPALVKIVSGDVPSAGS